MIERHSSSSCETSKGRGAMFVNQSQLSETIRATLYDTDLGTC